MSEPEEKLSAEEEKQANEIMRLLIRMIVLSEEGFVLDENMKCQDFQMTAYKKNHQYYIRIEPFNHISEETHPNLYDALRAVAEKIAHRSKEDPEKGIVGDGEETLPNGNKAITLASFKMQTILDVVKKEEPIFARNYLKEVAEYKAHHRAHFPEC